MLRLTKRMEDGSYQANNNPKLPGENSYQYKNMIIDRCGRLEDFFERIDSRMAHQHSNGSITTCELIFSDLEEFDL